MPLPLLEPVSEGAPTFLGAPRGSLESLTTPFGAMGAPFGVPYTIRNVHHGASEAPGALGAASARFGRMLKHDFDLGGTRSDGHPWPIVDHGDGPADHGICRATLARVMEAVACGRRPGHGTGGAGRRRFGLGAGDPRTRAGRPTHRGEIDAHIDFRDEVGGVHDGYSSPMRRTTEMSWVERIVHVGTRGQRPAARRAGHARGRQRDHDGA
jgi:agmatinase